MRIKDVSLFTVDYKDCNHLFQSNILPFHRCLPFSTGSFKGHPCRVSSCKNFPHFNRFWQSEALGTFSVSLLCPFPHIPDHSFILPWTVWKVFYPLPALSFEAVLKVEWQMLRVEVYFGEEQRWPKLGKIFCLPSATKMTNDATSAGFIFKLIIFVWTNYTEIIKRAFNKGKCFGKLLSYGLLYNTQNYLKVKFLG